MEQFQTKDSEIIKAATDVVKMLEARGFKTAEIMAICLSASKAAESIIQTRGIVAIQAVAIRNFINE